MALGVNCLGHDYKRLRGYQEAIAHGDQDQCGAAIWDVPDLDHARRFRRPRRVPQPIPLYTKDGRKIAEREHDEATCRSGERHAL